MDSAILSYHSGWGDAAALKSLVFLKLLTYATWITIVNSVGLLRYTGWNNFSCLLSAPSLRCARCLFVCLGENSHNMIIPKQAQLEPKISWVEDV